MNKSHKPICHDVYIFGAGLNRCMFNLDLLKHPPLIADFFQIALRIDELMAQQSFHNDLSPLLDYIYKNWKISKKDLSRVAFNLEECFTIIESDYRRVLSPGSFDSLIDLFDLRFKLRTLIFRVLSEFRGCQFQSELRALGQILFNDKPGIISFNYDDFVESVIELASRPRIGKDWSFVRSLYDNSPITVNEIAYSNWNWNRPLAYGMKFDLVMIHDSSMHAGYRRKYVEGELFYKHPKNKLYSWGILKLHGSLNWFRYIPPDATPPSLPLVGGPLTREMENHIIIGEGDWGLQKYPTINSHYVEPVIVTPDIYKSERFTDPIFKNKLLLLWKQAKVYLSKCKKLIVIGYSFPEADGLTKELFESSFTNNMLDKLTVVNPDQKAVEKAKYLCKAKEVIQFKDLKDFIEDYKLHLPWYNPHN